MLVEPATSSTGAPRQAARSATLVRSKNGMSRRTNVLHVLPNVNPNSSEGRRFADVVLALVAELGGGASLPDHVKMQIRQVGAFTIQTERMQAAIVRGEPVDMRELVRITNTLNRMLKTLGLKHRKVSADRSLGEILRGG
jgi:hypothetical protein